MAHWFTGKYAYLGRVALALEGSTEVVDDDGSTARAEEQAVGLTKTTAGTGDNDDLAVEPQLLSHFGYGVCVVMMLETNEQTKKVTQQLWVYLVWSKKEEGGWDGRRNVW